MAGLFSALNTAATSMQVSQKQIEVTGNNIANVDTAGYSRQSAVTATTPSLNHGGFFIGQGVTITDVARAYNGFVTNQILDKSVDFGYESSRTPTFTELESIFSIKDDNLSSQVDTFFDSWQQLATDPSDTVLRDIVIQQGGVLCKEFNNVANELDQVQKNISSELESMVEDANAKLEELADLNDRIYNMECQGTSANSARDQRDVLLQEMAETFGASSYETSSGMVNVSLPSGLPLVTGNTAAKIEGIETGTNFDLMLHAAGTSRPLSGDSIGGKFAGLMQMKEEVIPELENDLDQMAYAVMNAVNDVHKDGAGLDGSTGLNFFKEYLNPNLDEEGQFEWTGAARNMAVDIEDPNKIAAAKDPDSGIGDNSNAQKIAKLSYELTMNNGTDSFNSFYGKIVSTVGIASNENKLSVKNSEDALVQVQNLRDSYVGVSMDEEMISLIQFQRNYQGAAQYLSVVDELMGELINLK